MPWWTIHEAMLGGLGLVWLGAALFTNRAVKREGLRSRASYAVVLLPGFLLIFKPLPGLALHPLPQGDPAAIAGLAVSAIGITFAICARAHLGRMWSGSVTLKQDHHLVRSGPYALVRHPIYTGVFFAVLGAALHVDTLSALLGCVLVLVGFFIKARKEDRLLATQFGADHDAYRAKVKMLLPFVL